MSSRCARWRESHHGPDAAGSPIGPPPNHPPDGDRRGHRITRLIEAGQWRAGDPADLVIFDVGYDVPRLAFLLADLPIEVLGRLRSDRVLYLPVPARPRHQWPAAQARWRVRPRRLGHLGRAAGCHHDPDHPVWHRRGTSLGPAAPAAHHRSAWLDHDGASRARGWRAPARPSPRPRAGDGAGPPRAARRPDLDTGHSAVHPPARLLAPAYAACTGQPTPLRVERHGPSAPHT